MDLFSDSQYVLNGLRGVDGELEEARLALADKEAGQNRELWESLDELKKETP